MGNPEINENTIDVAQITDALVQKASGFLDPKIRATYVAERITLLDEETIIKVLQRMIEGAARRLPGYREFFESGIEPTLIARNLDRFKFSRFYHAANRQGRSEIVTMFSGTRPARSAKEGDEDLFQVYGLADRTVGERRFMARSNDKMLLDKVGYDVNPMVVRQLLQNPRLNESDVMKIASRRPNQPEVLTEIYKNKKWLARYDVKFALVANPHTPQRITRALLPFLLYKDLRALKTNGLLSPEVRKEAKRLYDVKRIEKDRDDSPGKS